MFPWLVLDMGVQRPEIIKIKSANPIYISDLAASH
jgi:hypothetical protein